MPARTRPKPKTKSRGVATARKAAPKSRGISASSRPAKALAPRAASTAKRGPQPPVAFSHFAAAERYVAGVLDGSISACKWTRLACARHRRDMARARSGWRYEFDHARAERACRIIELLPHIKGEKAKLHELIRLEPWQAFIVVSLFGWVDSETKFRRFHKAYIEVPRKNGKSTLLAAILIVLTFFDDEEGADGYSAATTRDQARIVFKTAKDMIQKSPELRARYGVELLAHSVIQDGSGSKIEALSADAHTLDGLNPHAAVIDELHAHKTREVYDVIETAQGARAQPVLVVITTAGDDLQGICYEQRTYVTMVLEQATEDEVVFGVIYTIDQGDNWLAPESWAKANPNFGISVKPEYLEGLARKASRTPAAQANFKTKHLDVWVSTFNAYYDVEEWKALEQPGLREEDFSDERCIVGLDLASRRDIASMAKLYDREGEDGKTHFYVFTRNYLPEKAIVESKMASYSGWAEEGLLQVTPGDEIDLQQIEEDVTDLWLANQVRLIGFDPDEAILLNQRLEKEGAKTVEIRPTLANFDAPMKELNTLIAEKRIHHNGDKVLAWAIGNVVTKANWKEQVYPRKLRDENKIDPAVATMIALGLALRIPNEGPTVLETEGIRFA